MWSSPGFFKKLLKREFKSKSNKKRLVMEMPIELWDRLEALCYKTDKDVFQLISRALATYEYLVEQEELGNVLVVKTKVDVNSWFDPEFVEKEFSVVKAHKLK